MRLTIVEGMVMGSDTTPVPDPDALGALGGGGKERLQRPIISPARRVMLAAPRIRHSRDL